MLQVLFEFQQTFIAIVSTAFVLIITYVMAQAKFSTTASPSGKMHMIRRIWSKHPPAHEGCRYRTRFIPMEFSQYKLMTPSNTIVSPTFHTVLTTDYKNSKHSMLRRHSSYKSSSDSWLNDIPPGCEPDGDAAKEMIALFPEASIKDIVRFLIARKGHVSEAVTMFRKAREWKANKLPPSRQVVQDAIQAKCFFPHGEAKDGTQVLYFRMGMYDRNRASYETYVLAAAHTVDYALRKCDQVSVVAHTSAIPGGPNHSLDLNFVKYFVEIMSDNYPERLRRLIIFPFPWYGTALWNVIKVFMDQRTQEKIQIYSCDDDACPVELLQYIDIHNIPAFCGGKSREPIFDVLDTLSE